MKLWKFNLLILWFLMPIHAQSQMPTGVIRGIARDSSGAALPGVTIMLKHRGIGISRTYRSSSAGNFTAALLPVGTYQLSAQLLSFDAVKMPAVKVTPGRTRSVELVMRHSIPAFNLGREKTPETSPILP